MLCHQVSSIDTALYLGATGSEFESRQCQYSETRENWVCLKFLWTWKSLLAVSYETSGKERDWTVVNRLKKETKNICRQALGVVCSFLFVCLSTIRAESVGPLRRIYQRFSPLPIFNVDPHYAGTATPLLSATLRQGVRRGILFWDYF